MESWEVNQISSNLPKNDMAWIVSLPRMCNKHAQDRLRPCTPKKGRPYLGSQNTVQVASGSGTHETGCHEASQDLRNLWEIATANGDLCKVVCLIRIRMN